MSAIAPARRVKPPKTEPLNVLIDKMDDLREQRRKIAAEDKILKEEYDAIDIQLVAALKNQGIEGARGATHTASISSSTQYSVNDFDAFMAWVAKKKLWTVVQRRVSVDAMREQVELSGVVPPGIEQYTQEKIALRKLS
jgi:hypothetical protein